jgi:uncharacterized protein YcaQ
VKRERLSAAQARRIALAAQGFGAAHPRRVTRRDIQRTAERLGAIQIDSVNVLVRSQYLPLFSRLGVYDRSLLEKAAYAPRDRTLFEYWAHEASLIPIALHPLLRWRMEQAERLEAGWTGMKELARTRRGFVDGVLAQIQERGALSARELVAGGKSAGSWWGWSDGKRALEWLFWAGKVTTAYRRGFERVYDLPERVLPPSILALAAPPRDAAQRALLRIAANAFGVATERDLRDYFRLPVADAKEGIAALVESGELHRVHVEGWKHDAYLAPGVSVPRNMTAQALLSPFDSLVWERARTERLFGFTYRLAFYTPAHKREHGYYVLPFLYGDRLVARVDLKSSRRDQTLDVHAVHHEPGCKTGAIAAALDEELKSMAAWLGFATVRRLRR